MERITSTSRNLKGTYVRRLQQVCCKARAISAELQLRTTVALRTPANSLEIERKKEERERENPRLKESVRYGNERREETESAGPTMRNTTWRVLWRQITRQHE